MIEDALFVNVEIFGVVFCIPAGGRHLDTEVAERFDGGPQVEILVAGALVGGVHQRVGGEPVALGADCLHIRLSAKDKQEARGLVVEVDAEKLGCAHVARQDGSRATGVVGRHIADHHEETKRTVQDDLSVIGLLFQGVLGSYGLFFPFFFVLVKLGFVFFLVCLRFPVALVDLFQVGDIVV